MIADLLKPKAAGMMKYDEYGDGLASTIVTPVTIQIFASRTQEQLSQGLRPQALPLLLRGSDSAVSLPEHVGPARIPNEWASCSAA